MANSSPDSTLTMDYTVLQLKLFHGASTIHAMLAMTYSGLAHQEAATLEIARLEEAGKLTPRQKEDFRFTKIVNLLNTEHARAGAEAAAIIYAHSILDALVFGLCEFLAQTKPDSWLPLISEKKVSFQDVRSKSSQELQRDLIGSYLEQLERQSLVLKCDILFKVMRPASLKRILPKYNYSRDRLVELDKIRHNLVHKLKFSPYHQRPRAKVDFLLNTGQFFLNLASKHLGLSSNQPVPRTEKLSSKSKGSSSPIERR